jgi:hypothetical protein
LKIASLAGASVFLEISVMSIEPDPTASGAVIVDLAAHRARRAGRTAAGHASSATPRVMWVPMMMMVLMPVPVGGVDRTHAG